MNDLYAESPLQKAISLEKSNDDVPDIKNGKKLCSISAISNLSGCFTPFPAISLCPWCLPSGAYHPGFSAIGPEMECSPWIHIARFLMEHPHPSASLSSQPADAAGRS
jgi:hypothetical protein